MLSRFDAPPSAWSSALIAVLVGFGGTVALIVQAVQTAGGGPAQVVSAVTALCIGMAIAGAGLSLALRMPIVLAWSTPGAALVGASTLHLGWPTAIGAFLAAGAMMTLLGLAPALGRLANRIPASVASAMLAGVLLPFCLGLFRTFQSDLLLPALLLGVFLVLRQRAPLYAMLGVLAASMAVVFLRGDAALEPGAPLFGALAPAMPAFDLAALVGLAVPLFLVTLVSQNLPGLVVLRSAGYAPPAGPILVVTGVATMLLAPFGAHGVNLAAITAAICTNEDAHPVKERRWIVAVIYAGFYGLLALFAAPLVALFLAMPPTTIAAITGIALLAPLAGALEGMLAEPQDREAALLTFVATASGVSLWGVGAAFWGLAAGFLALLARRWLGRRREAERRTTPARPR